MDFFNDIGDRRDYWQGNDVNLSLCYWRDVKFRKGRDKVHFVACCVASTAEQTLVGHWLVHQRKTGVGRKLTDYKNLTNQKSVNLCVWGFSIRVRGITPRHIKTMYTHVLQKVRRFHRNFVASTSSKAINSTIIYLLFMFSQKTS